MSKLNVNEGDTLYLVDTPEGNLLTAYSEEVAKQIELTKEVMREDRDVLKALAK